MTYQVLARKWRPRLFRELVGQEHVLRALVHALDQERVHHAYLFTGTRGVGKTTIGRILARCLSCETGIRSEPCGTCDSCREILDGRFVDLIEIDAASRTRVEDMRELLDNVQYAPTRGRYKIYLIDEVHMLSNSSFNALLKTLEEPPAHVKFLFATTDPQKLPVTVLSRCLQFNLKRMTVEGIAGHLERILGEEKIPFEPAALRLLAKAADGSMRDALSLSDQAIAYGGGVLETDQVSAMLGTVDQGKVFSLVNQLVANDAQGLLSTIEAMSDFAPDYRQVLADLLDVFHRCAMEQVLPGSTDDSFGDSAAIRELAERLSAEDVQLFYQSALMSRRDLEISPDARMGFEMALLRMLAFRPLREADVEAASAQKKTAQVERGEAGAEQVAAEPASARAPEAPVDEPADGPADGMAPSEQAGHSPPMPEPEPAYEPEPEPEPDAGSKGGSVEDHGADFHWARDFDQLGLTGMTGNLAAGAALRVEQGRAVLVVDEGHYRLLNERHRQRIEAVLRERLPGMERFHVEQGEPGRETPAVYREQRKALRKAQAVEAIQQDPHVEAIIRHFDGRLVEDSIEPL